MTSRNRQFGDVQEEQGGEIAEREDGADTEIDAAGDQAERHAEGDEAELGVEPHQRKKILQPGIVGNRQRRTKAATPIIKVKGITGSNHCFSSSSESNSRGDRLACNRVPKLVSMVLIDINALPSAGSSRFPMGDSVARRSRNQPCYFLSVVGAIGTGEVAAVFGRAKQLPPLALLLSSQIGCV